MVNVSDYNLVVQWSYSLAKKWVKENLIPIGVNSSRKFLIYKNTINKLPKHFPRRPDEYFGNRGFWKGWSDFFSKKNGNKRKFYSYKKTIEIVRKAGISNSRSFSNWKSRPSSIPARPDLYYKEWTSWMDFLGENYIRTKSTYKGKLTETDVKIIKHQLSMGVRGSILASHFKVSEMQISRIKHGENWKD